MQVKVFVPLRLDFKPNKLSKRGEMVKTFHFPSDPSEGMVFVPFKDEPELKIITTGFLPGGNNTKRFIRTENLTVKNNKVLKDLKKDGWKLSEEGEALL